MGVTLRHLIEDAVDGSFTLTYPDGSTAAKLFRQRSFDYGDDKPLITTALPDLNDDPNKIAIQGDGAIDLDIIDGVTDNFIRGGVALAGKRAAIDTVRITKFLTTPQGIAHLAAQVALSKSNPDSLVEESRQYSPLNLIAQIPSNVVPTLNIRRDGRIPVDSIKGTYLRQMDDLYSLNGGNNNVRYGAGDFGNPKTLASLYDKFTGISSGENLGVFNTNVRPLEITEAKAGGNTISLIKSYNGGAGSYFGIGKTELTRVTNTNELTNLLNTPDSARKDLAELPGYIKTRITQENETIRNQYSLGDPGKVKVRRNTDPSIDVPYIIENRNAGIDKINSSPIISRYNLEESALDGYKDTIKFRFALIDTSDPLADEVILFRAYLDDYNDNLQGKWTPYQYNGRAEDFHVYGGFGREINFNFKIGAQSERELLPLYFKLNSLMGSTAPEYVNRRMRGRYIRITLGDILSDVPGFFNNINITWNPSYSWEISEGRQLPQAISVNCNFTPIHDFTPQSNPDSPFILTRDALKEAVNDATIIEEIFTQNN